MRDQNKTQRALERSRAMVLYFEVLILGVWGGMSGLILTDEHNCN